MKLYRHRISIPASVCLDIITDTPEVPANYVEAVANYNFNLDEGHGLDHMILDGRNARLYLATDKNGLNIKEFSVEDVSDEESEESPDVDVCTACSEIVPLEYRGDHERYDCPKVEVRA